MVLCELTSVLVSEIQEPPTPDELWLRGGYPGGGLFNAPLFPEWQSAYLTLLAQRDLPAWGLPATPQVTQRLFKMLALCHGQIWNASQIGKSLALNYHTINSYTDYLVNTFHVRMLPAYHANLRKRLVRSPKLYWRDTGLLHALLGVRHFDELLTQPWLGFSWEGWVIEQILNDLTVREIPHDAFYYRTQTGDEMDLVLEIQNKRWAFEIKLSSHPGPDDVARLKKNAAVLPCDYWVLISRTTEGAHSSEGSSTDLRGVLNLLREHFPSPR